MFAHYAGLILKTTGAFGANRIPDVLRPVEILGIIQARSWKVASLNEFRRFIREEPYKTFEEMNPDPFVANTLRTLYNHPDNVEMYPGLFLEQTSPRQDPGTGISKKPCGLESLVLLLTLCWYRCTSLGH